MARVQKMDDKKTKIKQILFLRESWTNNICTIVMCLFQQSVQAGWLLYGSAFSTARRYRDCERSQIRLDLLGANETWSCLRLAASSLSQ
jgi:hypothetical protein